MGRLTTEAKNHILNLRFEKSLRIKQIAACLLKEDNIKISRKSIGYFLKKYIETKSINDKPRSGRNKKLTQEEINLIGEITRLNPDISAPKIKEYLNLNVSTYTILRASKLFDWNKLNPNSNEGKKAAALKRQQNGETKKISITKCKSKISLKSQKPKETETFLFNLENFDFKLLDEIEILSIKNESTSPMIFSTKLLFKLFEFNELIGHNVSGKTFNKYLKDKKVLDKKRIAYIKWLVEKHFDEKNKQMLWKSCRTAINKCIRNMEKKGITEKFLKEKKLNAKLDASLPRPLIESDSTIQLISVEPNTSQLQIKNESNNNQDLQLNTKIKNENTNTHLITLTDTSVYNDLISQDNKNKKSENRKRFERNQDENTIDSMSTELINLNILPVAEIVKLKNNNFSPTVFSTKILLRIFSREELLATKRLNRSDQTRLISNKDKKKNSYIKLDSNRINYIKWLVQNYYDMNDDEKFKETWNFCKKAINRIIRSIQINESKLIKSIDNDINAL